MMPTRRQTSSAVFSLCALATLFAFPAESQETKKELPLDKIRLPEGFSISIYSDEVPNARAMALGDQGTLFVGSRMAGKVYAVVDTDGDYQADDVHLLAEGLLMPTGLTFRDGSLYIAEIHSIHRLDDIENRLADPPQPVLIKGDLPKVRHHGWKFIAFGPDGWLYVPVGAPCNMCESKRSIYASIARMKPDGSLLEVVAHGVRNTVGFDWHPETGELWFTENGRDWMGDDIPPDELNVLSAKGEHFGYPYCHGQDIPDETYEPANGCDAYTPPVQDLDPHVAAIGMRFYDGQQFPDDYKHDVLIAEHGSWNRSEAIGYRITRVQLDGKTATSYETFAEGWLGEDGRPWGRPADVEVMPDGSLLVSDDRAGAIYRITFDG